MQLEYFYSDHILQCCDAFILKCYWVSLRPVHISKKHGAESVLITFILLKKRGKKFTLTFSLNITVY